MAAATNEAPVTEAAAVTAEAPVTSAEALTLAKRKAATKQRQREWAKNKRAKKKEAALTTAEPATAAAAPKARDWWQHGGDVEVNTMSDGECSELDWLLAESVGMSWEELDWDYEDRCMEADWDSVRRETHKLAQQLQATTDVQWQMKLLKMMQVNVAMLADWEKQQKQRQQCLQQCGASDHGSIKDHGST